MKHVPLLIMLACAISRADAQQVLSLDSCRAMALRNNKQLAIAALKQDVARDARKAARTKSLPHVDVLGGYEFTSREVSILNDRQKGALGSLGTNAAGQLGSTMSDVISEMAGQGIITSQTAEALGNIAQGIMPGIEEAGNNMGKTIRDAFKTDTRNFFAASIMLTQPIYMGGSIIAANKIAASSDYQSYLKLKRTALERGVKFLFETNVGAGLPIIGTINDLINSGDKILKIEAVLSGTLNFIFNEISADVPFSETVRRAKEQGYSEPDPRIDLSGTDVIRKLVILAREAGYKVEQDDVEKNLFIPSSYFSGSVENFWEKLPMLDAEFEERRKKLEADGKHWRFVATMDHGKTSVSLKAVDRNHPFYNLEGSNNIVLLTTERYKEYPMLIQGYGAGASVTAAGVFANIMSIANI